MVGGHGQINTNELYHIGKTNQHQLVGETIEIRYYSENILF